MHSNHNLEGFKQFIDKIIGNDLISESSLKVHQTIQVIPCPVKYVSMFEDLMCKFPNVEFRFIKKGKIRNYIFLEYLEQYYYNDENTKQMYEELSDGIFKIRDLLWDEIGENITYNKKVKAETSYNVDFNFYTSAIKTRDEVSYIIFDHETKDEVCRIVRNVLKSDIDFYRNINVQNKNYDINGVCVIKIHNNVNEHRYNNFINDNTPYYKVSNTNSILGELYSKRIPVCSYEDIHGEIKFSPGNTVSEKSRGQEGWRSDLECVFLSSWEANLARILKYKGLKWDFESKSYQLKTHHSKTITDKGTKHEHTYYYSYRPDFHLDNNTIIEVKGFWDSNSVEVVSCFKNEYGDSFRYCILDGDMFYTLNKIYANKIPHWEPMNLTDSQVLQIPVVGITQPERRKCVSELDINDEVILKRDKDNKFDRNAIQVVNSNGNLIGFIAKHWASIYADKIDLGMTFKAYVIKKEPKVITIKVQRTNIDEDIVYDIIRDSLIENVQTNPY